MGRVGGRMVSSASSRDTPLALPSLRSTFQPLNHGICVGEKGRVWCRAPETQDPGQKLQPAHQETPFLPLTPISRSHEKDLSLERVVAEELWVQVPSQT